MGARRISRRDALRRGALIAGAAWLGGRPAAAIGERTQLVLASLRLPGLSEPRPGALSRLAWELNLRTSVVASYDVVEVSPEAVELFRTPFLFLSGASGFPPLSDVAIRNLRRHLEFGGLLVADDASGFASSEFDRSVRRLSERLFPDAPLSRLGDDHSIFRTYYLLRRLGGRVAVSPFLEGATLGERTPLIYTRNDVAGAWARDRFGRWLHECVPGGASQRQQAFAFGVNAVLYALTVNYKQDQIHVPFIRERMRR